MIEFLFRLSGQPKDGTMFAATANHDPTRRTIHLLYGVKISQSMVFLVPVIVPYFAQEIGLTFQEFLASESVFAATVVLMEVPSGWLADIWKRKSAIVLGGIFAATGMALLLPADGFFDTAVAQAFMGVGISLFSGADSALLYDALHQHGRADRYRVIEGRRHGFGMYAVALSSLVGAWLFTIDPILTVWGMIVSYLATAGFALFLADPERRRHIAAAALVGTARTPAAKTSAGTAHHRRPSNQKRDCWTRAHNGANTVCQPRAYGQTNAAPALQAKPSHRPARREPAVSW